MRKIKLIRRLEEIEEDLETALADIRKLLLITEYQQLIEEHGWTKVSRMFHPDNNPDDELAFEKYNILKNLYDIGRIQHELDNQGL